MEPDCPHPGARAGAGRDLLGGWSLAPVNFEMAALQWPPILAKHWLRRSDWEAWQADNDNGEVGQ